MSPVLRNTSIAVVVVIALSVSFWQLSMPPEHTKFASHDGVPLAYHVEGQGPLIVLLHAFMIESSSNWRATRLSHALLEQGFRVAWLDARGHGLSDKPHDAVAYADDAMSKDVSALLDQLNASRVVLVGYSMGANVALRTAMLDPRVVAVVVAGTGLPSDREWDPVDRAKEVQSLRERSPANPGFYRRTADMIGGGDRSAFAARLEGGRIPLYRASELQALTIPVCIINGHDDLDPDPLAELLQNAVVFTTPGDHFSTIYQDEFRDSLISCLKSHQ